MLIGVNLSSNTQFTLVLDPPIPLKRGQKILVPPLFKVTVYTQVDTQIPD